MIFIIQIDITGKTSSSSGYKNIKINSYRSKNAMQIRTQRKRMMEVAENYGFNLSLEVWKVGGNRKQSEKL